MRSLYYDYYRKLLPYRCKPEYASHHVIGSKVGSCHWYIGQDYRIFFGAYLKAYNKGLHLSMLENPTKVRIRYFLDIDIKSGDVIKSYKDTETLIGHIDDIVHKYAVSRWKLNDFHYYGLVRNRNKFHLHYPNLVLIKTEAIKLTTHIFVELGKIYGLGFEKSTDKPSNYESSLWLPGSYELDPHQVRSEEEEIYSDHDEITMEMLDYTSMRYARRATGSARLDSSNLGSILTENKLVWCHR